MIQMKGVQIDKRIQRKQVKLGKEEGIFRSIWGEKREERANKMSK